MTISAVLLFFTFNGFLAISRAEFPAYHCSDDLGLSSVEKLPDSSFSSSIGSDSTPHQGRYNNNAGAWYITSEVGPLTNVSLTVDLGEEYFVSAILWQGAPAVSDFSYRISIHHSQKDTESWTEEDFRLVINGNDDPNHVTAIKPQVWKITKLRYIKISILEVVRSDGLIGGRLGLVGCKEFSPKVDGSLQAHVEGGASISWSKPTCAVQVLEETITFFLKEDYFVLSCRHFEDGPPDFIDSVTDYYYIAAKMHLGVTYTFKLICHYQGMELDCGTWSDVAYPSCLTDWNKNIEFCYYADTASSMTKQLAADEYNKTNDYSKKATFQNVESQSKFISGIWPNPESPFLLMDKECFSTDCCHRYFKNDKSELVFEKSCEPNIVDPEHIILFVRYVPAVVANCSDIESAINGASKTIITFTVQGTGWPTPMRAQIFDESSNAIFQEEVDKANTTIAIPDLTLYSKYTFQCTPYMTDDWVFEEENEGFINVETTSGQTGSFMPDIKMNSCNQWNGKMSFIWNTASAKFIDADGHVINIPADMYKFMYRIFMSKSEISSEEITQTETSYSIANLHVNSDIETTVTCIFSDNLIPCSHLNKKAEPPKVIRVNDSHFMAYEVKKEPMVWEKSELSCQACGGHLASIESKPDEEPLKELTSAKEQFHVGISSCAGSSGKWTDGKLFSYIPNNGHVYYRDKCCGSVSVNAAQLNLSWVNCEEEFKHACLTVIQRPQLKINCKAETTKSIFCQWSKDKDFWEFTSYNVSLEEKSQRETEIVLLENIDKTSHNFTQLKELTLYDFKIESKLDGYPVTFRNERLLYSGYKEPYEWSVDLNGTLKIVWPEFIAHGDTSKAHNITCKGDQDEKSIKKTNLDPLAIVIQGFLYGLNYTCNMKGNFRENSTTIETSFNFTAVPSCDKDFDRIGDSCFKTKTGNSSGSSDTHASIVNMPDQTKEIIIEKINETTVWVSHSPGNCCYADINTLKNQICSTDSAECAKNRTIIVEKDVSPPFCKLKSITHKVLMTEVILKMIKSNCWGNHYIKITVAKRVNSKRRKRSTSSAAITQDPNYTVKGLDPGTTYDLTIEPSTADGKVSSNPNIADKLTVTTLSESSATTDLGTNSAALKGLPEEPMIAIRIAACSVVILCVGLTLIIFIYSRMFHQDSICMLCSSISIIGTYVSILLGTAEAHHITYVSKDMCFTMAVVLHYFSFAMFFFLLLELMCMCRLIVNIPSRDYLNNSWFIFVAGWGLPFLVVLITAAALQKEYISDLNCWVTIDGAAFLPLIIPLGIIVICSLFFILILLQSHDLDKDDMKLLDYERAQECMSSRWATVVIFIIVTTCWILGMFGENKHDKDCFIGFVVMSFLLGFSYIIIRCASESEVRTVIANAVCCLPSNENYRWGSYVGKSKIRDIPQNQSQVHLTKYQTSPYQTQAGSMSSMRSFDSNVSTITRTTTNTEDSEYRDDMSSESRPSTAGSTIAPLRRASENSMRFAPRFRPGTAAIKR